MSCQVIKKNGKVSALDKKLIISVSWFKYNMIRDNRIASLAYLTLI